MSLLIKTFIACSFFTIHCYCSSSVLPEPLDNILDSVASLEIQKIKKIDKFVDDLQVEFEKLRTRIVDFGVMKSLNSTTRDFLNTLLHTTFANGRNFPIDYNDELKDFEKQLNIPFISLNCLEIGTYIFKILNLSSNGNAARVKFIMLISEYENFKRGKYNDLIVCVDFLHRKFARINSRKCKLWDQNSFEQINKLRSIFNSCDKDLKKLLSLMNNVFNLYNNFSNEWTQLSDDQKYEMIYEFGEKDTAFTELSFIEQIYETKANNIKCLYSKLLNFLVENGDEVEFCELDEDDLRKYINFIYDYSLISREFEYFYAFYRKFSSFYGKIEYKILYPELLKKYESHLKNIQKLQFGVINYENLGTVVDIVQKRILYEVDSKPNALNEFIIEKYNEAIRIGEEGIKIMIDLLKKDFSLTEIDAKKYINNFENLDFDFNKFPKFRLEFYSAYSHFLSYDSFSQYFALEEMVKDFDKQLIFLGCGSSLKFFNDILTTSQSVISELGMIVKCKNVVSILFYFHDS
ncbi:hypothetical protein H312_00666 [Anncaliia algerae PRA339]|uniref:Cullin family profile domain-containing protein n=1 Tax=Anncaliia algerae PRA339 TaxID=1288291 RepID=A0A059F472_9MICR|nr:hypothetical protein H312_00666 [Anncaliia algerae PRA339]